MDLYPFLQISFSVEFMTSAHQPPPISPPSPANIMYSEWAVGQSLLSRSAWRKHCAGRQEKEACTSGLDIASLKRVNNAFTRSGESTEFFNPWCIPQDKRWQLRWFARNYFKITAEAEYFYVVMFVALLSSARHRGHNTYILRVFEGVRLGLRFPSGVGGFSVWNPIVE